MAKSRAVGIDLGTTFSAMAWVDETGRSTLIPNDEGDLVTPSVVLFEDSGTVVGKEAKKVAVLMPDRVAVCVKRDMGKPIYSRPIRGKYLPPEVIQSYILKKLKNDITRKIGPEIQAVITVPAYFDEPRRKATYQAGEMAGLKVLDIVNEPTAAALAFGEDAGYLTRFGAPKQRMNVLVYDLGGGTFDATLIDMQAGNLRTICTDGDVQLGGVDWDMRLVDYMAEVFQQAHRIDPRQSPAGMQRMLNLAEETKHTLSVRSQARCTLTHENKTCEINVTRDLFEERTADLLERTRYTTRQLLATSGLEWKDIGRILLTGGSTRMPMAVRMLKELSGISPDCSVNPDEAVARGAAIYAGYLLASKGETGHEPTFDVSNVNAHSLGVEGVDPQTMRKRNKVLIPRNTALPARKIEVFVTKQLNQPSVVVPVLEGESLEPRECTLIGRTVIRDLPPGLQQGHPVDVTYQYGANGRLEVRAVVRGTDREVHLELEREDTMSSDRLHRWKRHVEGSGGLDAFDLAIQEELAELKRKAPASAAGGAAPIPTASQFPQQLAADAHRPPSTQQAPPPLAGSPTRPLAAGSQPLPARPPGQPMPSGIGSAGATRPVPLPPQPAKPAMAPPAAPTPSPTARPLATPVSAALTSGNFEEEEQQSWLGPMGYVLIGLATLCISYYLLVFLVPEANFLNLKLPGVSVPAPISEGEQR